MIKPTIGRVVWFWPEGDQSHIEGAQPLAALVAHVWSEECVNLFVVEPTGEPTNYTSVPLYQGEGERPKSAFAEWMPFQIGQAKRHEPEAPKPSLGRIVHYRKGVQESRAAIISGLHDDDGLLGLTVFTDNQANPVIAVRAPEIDPAQPGTGWYWPPHS